MAVSLDLSAVLQEEGRTEYTYRQISGFPGDYLTGKVTANPEASVEIREAFYVSDDGVAHPDEIAVTSRTNVSISKLSIPAYSLTRITPQ